MPGAPTFPDMSLSEKVAIVTGASGGIGEAIAQQLAVAGARVVVSARRLDELERVKNTIEQEVGPGRVLICRTDVTKREEVKALVAAAEAGFGPVDVMVNNAGGNPGYYIIRSTSYFVCHDEYCCVYVMRKT